MTVGSLVCALLVAAWSRVDSTLGLYLVMGGIGLARAAVLYDPAIAVVVRWFHTKRSAALLTLTVVPVPFGDRLWALPYSAVWT